MLIGILSGYSLYDIYPPTSSTRVSLLGITREFANPHNLPVRDKVAILYGNLYWDITRFTDHVNETMD